MNGINVSDEVLLATRNTLNMLPVFSKSFAVLWYTFDIPMHTDGHTYTEKTKYALQGFSMHETNELTISLTEYFRWECLEWFEYIFAKKLGVLCQR